MNEKEMIMNRIAKYKRKMAWHTNRLTLYFKKLEYGELYDNEILTIRDKILEHDKKITIYSKRLAWNTKRLAKCQSGVIAP